MKINLQKPSLVLGQVCDSSCEQPKVGTGQRFWSESHGSPTSRSARLLWKLHKMIFQLHGGQNRPRNGVKISKLRSSWVTWRDRVQRDTATLKEDSSPLTGTDGAAGSLGSGHQRFLGMVPRVRTIKVQGVKQPLAFFFFPNTSL